MKIPAESWQRLSCRWQVRLFSLSNQFGLANGVLSLLKAMDLAEALLFRPTYQGLSLGSRTQANPPTAKSA